MDFHNMFKCYETYCTQQSKCQQYCREKLQQEQDNDLFTAYLAVSVSLRGGGGGTPIFGTQHFSHPFSFFQWCETQKECNRLKLLDILVKPMQRLTKYSLLLKAILKHTINQNHKDSICDMVREENFFSFRFFRQYSSLLLLLLLILIFFFPKDKIR